MIGENHVIERIVPLLIYVLVTLIWLLMFYLITMNISCDIDSHSFSRERPQNQDC